MGLSQRIRIREVDVYQVMYRFFAEIVLGKCEGNVPILQQKGFAIAKSVFWPMETSEAIWVESYREGNKIVRKLSSAVVEDIMGMHRSEDRKLFESLAD